MVSLSLTQEQESSLSLSRLLHDNLLSQGEHFQNLESNANSQDGQMQLQQEKQLCGTAFFNNAIAFVRWFKEQSAELLDRLYRLNPYLNLPTLLKLPLVKDQLGTLLNSLEEIRREDGAVKLRDFNKILREFLPKRKPAPKFERGCLLTPAHWQSFQKKVLGKTNNPNLLAERELFYQEVQKTFEKMPFEEDPKVEHLVEAIRLCGGDPLSLLPKFKKYSDWEVEAMLQDLSDRLTESIQTLNEKLSSLTATVGHQTSQESQETIASVAADPYPEIIEDLSDLVGRPAIVDLGALQRHGTFHGKNGSSSTGIVFATVNGEEKKYTVKFEKIAIQYPSNSKAFCNLDDLNQHFDLVAKAEKST
jgi:hypothetical protein